MDIRAKVFDLANNIVAGFLCAGFSMIVAILYTHFGPAWARPLMNGLIAGSITLTLFMCSRAILALPRAKVTITPENAGPIVLGWLHKFNLEVKTLTDDECHFMYRVTTDGGKVITIRRSKKHFSDYLTVRALINSTDRDKAMIAALSDVQKAILRVKLTIALSNAAMGYKTRRG